VSGLGFGIGEGAHVTVLANSWHIAKRKRSVVALVDLVVNIVNVCVGWVFVDRVV